MTAFEPRVRTGTPGNMMFIFYFCLFLPSRVSLLVYECINYHSTWNIGTSLYPRRKYGLKMGAFAVVVAFVELLCVPHIICSYVFIGTWFGMKMDVKRYLTTMDLLLASVITQQVLGSL